MAKVNKSDRLLGPQRDLRLDRPVAYSLDLRPRPGPCDNVEVDNACLMIRGDVDVEFCHSRGDCYVHECTIPVGPEANLSLLMTKDQAHKFFDVQKLSHPEIGNCPPTITDGYLFNVPPEIREMIYEYALSTRSWTIHINDNFERAVFPRGIGDSSGFWFPLGPQYHLLQLNKRIRYEALPLAYRRKVHLEDLDDAVKFLIAVGEIGRKNILSIAFAWDSKVDDEYHFKVFRYNTPKLASLHAATCVALLEQCERLRSLQLKISYTLLTSITPDEFEGDRGLRALRSIRGILRVEIRNSDGGRLNDKNQCERAKILEQQIRDPPVKTVAERLDRHENRRQ